MSEQISSKMAALIPKICWSILTILRHSATNNCALRIIASIPLNYNFIHTAQTTKEIKQTTYLL